MEFPWRANNGPKLNAGLVAVIFQGIQNIIAKKPYIFVIFQGGPDPLPPPPPPPPSGSANGFDGPESNFVPLLCSWRNTLSGELFVRLDYNRLYQSVNEAL